MKKILVVDDEPNNLQIARQILKNQYQLLFATNGTSALAIAEQHQPDMVLLDIMMPGMDGYEVCKHLKTMARTQNTIVIFVTAMTEIESEARGFDLGAVDYIQKPICAPLLLRRIQTHLSLVQAKELELSQKETIFMLGKAGHFNDTDTGLHIWRMAAYSGFIAQLAGWSTQNVARLELAAPMHDTGKIGIPDNILKAPRKLTDDEWKIMKTHAQIGHDILSKGQSPLFKLAAEIALSHHERWDGSGYPQQLVGESIPESGRIVALADVFDALTTKRPYKQPWSVDEAIAEINRCAGSHFDPRLVQLLNDHLPQLLIIKNQWDARDEDSALSREHLLTLGFKINNNSTI